MPFTTVTVTATILEHDNVTPARGHIDFQLTNDMADGLGGRILARAPKRAVLDSNGQIEVELAATDDASTSPQGTLYLVTESIVGAPTRTYHLEVPAASPTLNLATVSPATPGAVFVSGPPGPTGPTGPEGPQGIPGPVISVNGQVGAVDLTGTYADADNPILDSTLAGLGVAGTSGRLRRVTDSFGRIYLDNGFEWFPRSARVNVKELGIKGNASDAAGNTVLLQALADAGVPAFFPKGTYWFNRIVLKSNMDWMFENVNNTFLLCKDNSAGSAMRRADDNTFVAGIRFTNMNLCTATSSTAAAVDANPDLMGLNLAGTAYGVYQNCAVLGFGQAGVVLARCEGGTEGLGFAATTQDGNYNTFLHLNVGGGKYNADEAAVWFKYKANSNKMYALYTKGGGVINSAVIAHGDDNLICGMTSETTSRGIWFKSQAVNNLVMQMRGEGVSVAVIKADAGSIGNIVFGTHVSSAPVLKDIAAGAGIEIHATNILSMRTGERATTNVSVTANYNFLEVLGLMSGADGILHFKTPGYNVGTVPLKLEHWDTRLAVVANDLLFQLGVRTSDSSTSAAGVNARMQVKAFDGLGRLGWVFASGTGDAPTDKLEIDNDVTVRNGRSIVEAATGPAMRLRTTKNDNAWVPGTDTFGLLEFWADDPGSAGSAGLRASVKAHPESSSGAGCQLSFHAATATTHDVEQLRITSAGNVVLQTAGGGLRVKEGTNAKQGVATLVAGTFTVPNTSVTANSRIQLTPQTLGTVTRPQALGVTARTPGTSFTVMSADATDTSTFTYEIFEPA